MDNVSIKRAGTLHPKLRDDITSILIECEKKGFPIRITRAFATFAEQDALYKIYQSGGPKAAPAGLSFHQYGLAVDMCLLHSDGTVSFSQIEDANSDGIKDWTEVVNVFEAHGWIWGASFHDNDHFQKSFGLTEQQCLDKYNNKDFIQGTQYINI